MTDDPDTPFTFTRQGILFIVSAPSGAGKTTLSQHLFARVTDLHPSISHTTRPPRAGEVDGRDYHFVTPDQFLRLRAADAFAEWAAVHDFLYGTSRAPLDETLARGHDLLLDIDVQGATQITAQYPTAVSIFILPPSWRELERRLRRRQTDDEAAIRRRLQRARDEARALPAYDYWVINDDVECAVGQLRSVITAERARVTRLRERATL